MKNQTKATPSPAFWGYILPVVIAVCSLSCSTAIVQPGDYNEEYVLFGDGGGFAGIVTSYALYENGQLMVKNHNDTCFQLLGKVQNHTARQLLDNYHTQHIADININVPGNTYYFLERKHKAGIKHRIVYDPYEHKIPKTLEQYVHTLNGLVRKIKTKETSK